MASVTDPATVAELKALRAFFHYVALDNFGNAILIRFGKFNNTWRFKPESPAHTRLFPIPNDQLKLNPNLKQNPGYPG